MVTAQGLSAISLPRSTLLFVQTQPVQLQEALMKAKKGDRVTGGNRWGNLDGSRSSDPDCSWVQGEADAGTFSWTPGVLWDEQCVVG